MGMFKSIAKFFSGSAPDADSRNTIPDSTPDREQIPILSPRSKLEADRESAGNRHNAILDQLVTQHSRVLRKKIRRHIRQDEYGKNVGLDEAAEEIAYFLSHVAQGDAEYRRARSEVIDLNVALSLLGQNADEFDTDRLAAHIGKQFDSNLIAYVYIVANDESSRTAQQTDTDIDSLSGEDFEIYCEDRLKDLGWSVHRKGGVGDQGVDLLASRGGIVVAIQCKRYSGAVGNQAIQQVEAGRQYEDADIAAVVSNSTYTSSARHLAAKLGIVLLHYSELDLLAERVEVE